MRRETELNSSKQRIPERMKITKTPTVLLLVCSMLAANARADQIPTKEGVAEITAPQFSPYAGRSYPTRVLWGDTHLHTAVSVDAGTMCRVGQEDAYRFARGEECARDRFGLGEEKVAAVASYDRALGFHPAWREAEENKALALARKMKMQEFRASSWMTHRRIEKRRRYCP